jgi:hypothetical protein
VSKALAPWLIPLAMVVAIAATTISWWIGGIAVAAAIGYAIHLRLEYLKEHPPEPELRRRNFWDFR